MKALFHTFFILLAPAVFSQGLTIEQCYVLAEQNFPTAVERQLIVKSAEYSLKNAAQGYLPSLSLSAKVSYQSDATSIPTLGGTPKDQYQLMGEATQALWDGGAVRAQKLGVEAQKRVQLSSLDVELYALRERVTGLFFGSLLLGQQIEQNSIYAAQLERDAQRVQSYIASGVGTATDLDAVQVEVVVNEQRMVELQAMLGAYQKMLSELVGADATQLQRPEELLAPLDTTIRRPELSSFGAQLLQVDAQREAIVAQSMPRLGLFVQGAYGDPGLDILKPGFTPYAIGGVRLTWSVTPLYSQKNDFAKLELQKSAIDARRRAFLLNTRLDIAQQNAVIKKAGEQLRHDEKIIQMRENIYRAAVAALDRGTISVLDMMRESTQLQDARQAKLIHHIEFMQSYYMLINITNNDSL